MSPRGSLLPRWRVWSKRIFYGVRLFSRAGGTVGNAPAFRSGLPQLSASLLVVYPRPGSL